MSSHPYVLFMLNTSKLLVRSKDCKCHKARINAVNLSKNVPERQVGNLSQAGLSSVWPCIPALEPILEDSKHRLLLVVLHKQRILLLHIERDSTYEGRMLCERIRLHSYPRYPYVHISVRWFLLAGPFSVFVHITYKHSKMRLYVCVGVCVSVPICPSVWWTTLTKIWHRQRELNSRPCRLSSPYFSKQVRDKVDFHGEHSMLQEGCTAPQQIRV